MKLIRGAPGSGKTAWVFREFKEALRAGRTDLYIVVPTATLVRHFQHELARDGVVFPPHCVVSLSRFARQRAAAMAKTEAVPDGLLRALVRDSLRRLRFPEFADVAETEGMASILIETIDLFETAGVTGDKASAIGKIGPRAKAFVKLWRAVGDAVRDRGFFMHSDSIRAAASNNEPAKIWLDGFLTFSPLEREFVSSLARCCDVTLTLTDSSATDEVRRFAMRLGAEDRLLPGIRRNPKATLVEASTLEREADEIARRVLAMHEGGTPFREIGVALRDAATYVPLLRGTFERFGIPARFYFSSPLRQQPAARFLGGLISGALTGWDFETAIETLRDHPRWGHSADFDRFDFAVREAMPGRGAEALLALCESDWLKQEIAACLKIEAWIKAPQLPAEWRRRFQALGTSVYRPGILDRPRDHADVDTARSHVAALRAWSDAIASIEAFWSPADQPISLEEFWRVASDAIETAVIHPVDVRTNVVHVMSVYEARQWDMQRLFVCGMTDRDFPRRHAQNLLFPDHEIERLQKAGIAVRSAADRDREERWMFDALRTRATHSLVLTVPARDASGKSTPPSLLAEDAASETEGARTCLPVPAVGAPPPAVAGRVNSPALHAGMAGLHERISLTSLEDLAQCGFKFFGSRTLGLKAAPERPAERLNARVTGSILHQALDRWIADKSRDFVELFEEAFDEMCRTERLPSGYKLEVERMQFREIARRVSANDLWNPEYSLTEEELTLDFPGGITVRGRVDRIDVFPDKDCVIVDYKSSKTASVEKLVTSRTRLQGPLYALAVKERLNLNPVAMVYWAVREDKPFGWGQIPGSSLELQPMPERWAEDARARSVEKLGAFLQGDVQPRPEETDPCRWCDFKHACRIEQQTMVAIGSGS